MRDEFQFIDFIRKKFPRQSRYVLEGIGDDCALLSAHSSQNLLCTKDLFIEGVHFDRAFMTPEQIGEKSFLVNLSDIVSKGGDPQTCLLGLGVPSKLSDAWLVRFINGFRRECQRFGVQLVGGDLCRSNRDIFVSVTMTGWTPHRHLKFRRNARPGDLICVTGNCGDSAIGFELLKRKKQKWIHAQKFIRAHIHPQIHVEWGMFLAQRQAVHAMMDLSDGLLSDCQRIAEASGIGIEVDAASVPRSAHCEAIAKKLGVKWTDLVLAGGEDYLLLLAVSKVDFAELKRDFERRFKGSLTPIGRCKKGEGIRFRSSSGDLIHPQGFRHFASKSSK